MGREAKEGDKLGLELGLGLGLGQRERQTRQVYEDEG